MEIPKEIKRDEMKQVRSVETKDFLYDVLMYNDVIIFHRYNIFDDYVIILPDGIVIKGADGYKAEVSNANYNEVLDVINQGSNTDVINLYEKLWGLSHDRQKEEELLKLLGYPLKVKDRENHLAIHYDDIGDRLEILPYLEKFNGNVYCLEDGLYEPCKPGRYEEEEEEEDEEEWCYEVEQRGGICETPPDEEEMEYYPDIIEE